MQAMKDPARGEADRGAGLGDGPRCVRRRCGGPGRFWRACAAAGDRHRRR
jgi:hypothetical protein